LATVPAEVIEAQLARFPAPVAERLRLGLSTPERAWWARTCVHALGLALDAGVHQVALAGQQGFSLLLPGGSQALLYALVHPQPQHPAGKPADLARLQSALDATFGARRYLLYLRRRLPDDFDPAPLARAATFWLAALDRGEWKGPSALYEDGPVAVELTLLSGERSRNLRVGPLRGVDAVQRLDDQVLDCLADAEEAGANAPLILVAGAPVPWSITRGFLLQKLYGMPTWIEADLGPQGGAGSFRAAYGHNERSLFGDPASRTLSTLWCLGPSPTLPLSFQVTALENPWCAFDEASLLVGSRRYYRESVSSGEHVLRWTGSSLG
jgi:hypothetical protein